MINPSPSSRWKSGQLIYPYSAAAPTRITVTDASGVTRTYGSVEEMPAEICKIYEQVARERTK